jgi:hypothetical protein
VYYWTIFAALKAAQSSYADLQEVGRRLRALLSRQSIFRIAGQY